MDSEKKNEQLQFKNGFYSRKVRLLLYVIAVFLCVINIWLPSFLAWLFDGWTVVWVLLGSLIVLSFVAFIVLVIKKNKYCFLFDLLCLVGLVSLGILHYKYGYGYDEYPVRWGDCLVSTWEGVYSKYGVKKVEVNEDDYECIYKV